MPGSGNAYFASLAGREGENLAKPRRQHVRETEEAQVGCVAAINRSLAIVSVEVFARHVVQSLHARGDQFLILLAKQAILATKPVSGAGMINWADR